MTTFAFDTTGTFLPRGTAALAMIEDALDHLVDGPRTSPSMLRRLLIRACDGDVGPDLERAIERFERSYDEAYAVPADQAAPPSAMNGGTRGRLLQAEALLRQQWSVVREGMVTAGVVAFPRSDDHGPVLPSGRPTPENRFAIPFSEDGFDGATDVDPDEPILMLEPAWSIERRERRRARLRLIGGHVARATLAAAAIGLVVASIAMIVGLQ